MPDPKAAASYLCEPGLMVATESNFFGGMYSYFRNFENVKVSHFDVLRILKT
jgi:hypothetical protein